uniref:Centromere protein X n=1 Tax=Fagus sylvatica TaxID=28930 RepID=A0A2N9F1V0_FAGSY
MLILPIVLAPQVTFQFQVAISSCSHLSSLTPSNSTTVGAGTSKKNRQTFANGKAIKLSCELFRIFITEAVQRAATIAEAEGASKIEATHLERILPHLLLDF